MINELEIDDGGEMESAKTKTSRYQVIPADRLESYRKEMLWGYLERSKMENPVYFRLLKNESFAGVKRTVTEYLPPGAARWQLDSIPHDDLATQKLSEPPMGIATLGREKITSTVKRERVTHPKSKGQTEPAPGIGREELTD